MALMKLAPFVLLMLFACGPTRVASLNLPPPIETNALGVGDVFEVYVYDEVSLSRPFKIEPDGTIEYPLVGRLAVDGKEPQEIESMISNALLEKKILLRPSVSIVVKEINSRKVSVFGQVQKPGQFPITEGMSAVQAISLAGGFTAIGDRDHVTLNRKLTKTKILRVVFSVSAITEGKAQDFPLQSGDTLFIEERIF
jgi:polysaccharide export outer membrane protein